MDRRKFLIVVGVMLAAFSPPSPAGGREIAAVAHPNGRFSLARVDDCFLAAPPPGPTSWPLAPIDRVHGIRGSFNGPRGSSPHFGVDVQALLNEAPVYSISSGYVMSLHPGVKHFGISVAPGHALWYWHVVPLAALYVGAPVRRGQLLGHVVKAYYHVHIAESEVPCRWINPMRPGGPLAVPANTERPEIGPLGAFVANGKAFRAFDPGTNPADQTDPATPLGVTQLHGTVDLRAEICDWPDRKMAGRPQLDLEPAAIRAFLAPASNRHEHVSRVKAVFDGAILLNPPRLGTTLWHIWAFGTWRDSSGYYRSGPNADTHLGAAYVWHVGGVSGLHTTQYRNGRYQYCVQALTINDRIRTRCTPVVIDN